MLRSTTLLLPSLLLSLASFARAGLTEMRATLPGSLHQCDATNVFFFDTDDSGSKTLLLVSPSDADSLGPGVLTLSSVLGQITPLQAVDGIDSPDATQFDFTLKLAEGTSFAALGFLSNGQGKNLNLPREVQSPLPSNANCLSGAAPASSAAQPASSSSSSTSPAPAPTTTTPSSTSTTPSSTVTPSSSSSSSPQYASRFVTSVRSSSSSSSTAKAISSIATSSAAISASLSLPPNSTATGTRAGSGGNATSTGASPAAAATSPVVVSAKYLLSSFIEISDDQSTDGAISSAGIKGGFVTGSVNGTILPIGNALFAANSSSSSTTAANATAAAAAGPGTSLISASYSFTDVNTGETVFVMAQTPLAQNFTTEALLMTFQSAQANSSAFANMTILGRPQTVNETMFRIDAYYLPTSEV